jgi:hypothetical protein
MVILKGYWIADVIFYQVYRTWETKGIIILRSLLLLLFLITVFLTIKKQYVPYVLALLLTAGVFSVVKESVGERPQLFTFLVFSLTYYVLEDARLNMTRKIFFIPLFMVLLSNMHPGYIICLVLVSIYLAGEGFRWFFSRSRRNTLFRDIAVVWALSIILSAFNPNAFAPLTSIISTVQGEHAKYIMEWVSPLTMYTGSFAPVNYSFIAVFLFSLLGFLSIRKTGATHLLLIICFTIMGMRSMRYMVFYMCILAPVIGKIMMDLKEIKTIEKLIPKLKRWEMFVNMTACVIGTVLVFNVIPSFARDTFKNNTFSAVPKGAADFLSTVEIQGNMFNEYSFGGYLIWRLYPHKRVFIDGRGLEYDVYEEYVRAINANSQGPQTWKHILKKYNITHIVMSPLFAFGEIYPLLEQLFISRDWELIYSDHLSLIFIRKNHDTIGVAEQFAIDKEKGLYTIIAQASKGAMIVRENPSYLISIGKAFFMLGKPVEAEKAFRNALGINPDNAEALFWLEKTRSSGSDVTSLWEPNKK